MQPLNARTTSAMSKVRQVRTTPEERVAEVLRELGKAYRRNVRNLPGKPDFANRSRGWVVQVHGCFWHHHDCKRGTVPVNNREAWLVKFAANRLRDQRVEADLRDMGLEVVTVWECETRRHSVLVERLVNLK